MVGELANLNVLVTRQFDAAWPLAKKIEFFGAKVQILPLFSIESLVHDAYLTQIQQQIVATDVAICISKNAAQIILPRLQHAPHLTWAAVGPSTAQYMQTMIAQKVLHPAMPPYDGNALIRQLQSSRPNLSSSHVMIFTGMDGANELQAWLIEEGATVTTSVLYRRILPAIALDFFTQIFCSKPEIDVIVITCTTSLANLIYFADLANIEIRQYKLLVVSNRIYKYAIERGFFKIYIAASMSEAGILSGLLQNYSSIFNV